MTTATQAQAAIADIIDTDLWGWFGPLDFATLTRRIEALCDAELVLMAGYGTPVNLASVSLFSTHGLHAAQARAIYAASPADAVQALHDAGLSDFAQAIETGTYDHLVF